MPCPLLADFRGVFKRLPNNMCCFLQPNGKYNYFGPDSSFLVCITCSHYCVSMMTYIWYIVYINGLYLIFHEESDVGLFYLCFGSFSRRLSGNRINGSLDLSLATNELTLISLENNQISSLNLGSFNANPEVLRY